MFPILSIIINYQTIRRNTHNLLNLSRTSSILYRERIHVNMFQEGVRTALF